MHVQNLAGVELHVPDLDMVVPADGVDVDPDIALALCANPTFVADKPPDPTPDPVPEPSSEEHPE